ncbi:hypothetical protein ACFLYU_01570 [Candidatus Dependentiae bacterium]
MRKQTIILSLIFFANFGYVSRVASMDFLSIEKRDKRDIWLVLTHNREASKYDFKKSIVRGLEESEKIKKFFEINSDFYISEYMLELSPLQSVSVFKGFFKGEKVFYQKVESLVCNVGMTISFDSAKKNGYKLEYIVLNRKSGCKKCNNSLCKSQKNIVTVFKPGSSKPILKKEFKKELFCYRTYKSKNCELIVFIFQNKVALFDLQTGKKITSIKLEEKVINTVINDKHSFIMFSANNKVRAISLKKKLPFWYAQFKATIINGMSIWRYLALVILSQDKEKRIISLLDVKKSKKGLIKNFSLDYKNYYGFCRGLKEYYFWVIDHSCKILNIYNLYPDTFKNIFDKKFDKKMINFKIEKVNHQKYNRVICFDFIDGSKKKFGIMVKKKKLHKTKSGFGNFLGNYLGK